MKAYIKLLGLLLVFGMLTTSCENVSVNENPNGVIVDDLLPEVVMPGAQVRPAALLMSRMNQLGNTMISTWSGNAQQVQAPYFDEFSQQVTADFYDDIWDGLYIRTSNLSNIIEFEAGDANYDYYKGAAKILKAFYFQYLVDTYGDIPYSEAHQRGDLLFPKYDNQAEVYRALVDLIDDAIGQINNTDTSTVIDMGSNDVMLNGNMEMWKKFGNTVKLRLLVRLMNLAETNGETQSYIQEKFANLNNSTLIGLGEDITINPGYTDDNGRANPFAATYGYNPGEFGTVGSETFGNRATGPTTFLVEMLNGTTNGISDSRLGRLYAVRGGQSAIQGNTQGGEGQPSQIGPGLLSSAAQDGYIMTAAESLFLQAEAAQRGYLTGSSAKSLFQDGISASFGMLGANIGSYLSDSDNINGIGWEGTSDKIEAIITQKWIALGGTNGLETWIEYNRTNYPSNMPLPDIATQSTQPKRMLYPTSEYTGNTANVSEYGQTNDSAFNTSIFWDVN